MTANELIESGRLADELLTFLSSSATPTQSCAALAIALGRVCQQFELDTAFALMLVTESSRISREFPAEGG